MEVEKNKEKIVFKVNILFCISFQCEPLYRGFGFRRGGYRCVCKPGYRYPPWQRGPFMGIDIESATEEEYRDGFDCIPVGRKYLVTMAEV